MKAVYIISFCCGDEVKRVKIVLPAGCTDPSDFTTEVQALKITGYDGHGRCGNCGNRRYRARYAGYPIPPIDGAIVSVEGLNRDHLIATLETLLAHLRVAPEYVSLIACNDTIGCIE